MAPPINDNLVDAIDITPGTISGTTQDASTEGTENSEWFSADVPTVWYKWTNSTGVARTVVWNELHAASPDFDPAGPSVTAWRFTGTPTDFHDLISAGSYIDIVFSSDNGWVSPTSSTRYGIRIIEDGESIYLCVGNTYNDDVGQGPFTFDFLVPIPSNDDFADAILLTGTSGSMDGTVIEATREADEYDNPYLDHAFDTYSDKTVWYYWVADDDGILTVTTDNGSGGGPYINDTTLYLFQGTDYSDLVFLTQNDDYNSGQSRIDYNVVSGETYYIRVQAYGGGTGAFGVNWDRVDGSLPTPPSNDEFIDAEEIPTLGTISGDSTGATIEPWEEWYWWGSGVFPVWYKFHNTGDDGDVTLTIDSWGGGFDVDEGIEMYYFVSPNEYDEFRDLVDNLTHEDNVYPGNETATFFLPADYWVYFAVVDNNYEFGTGTYSFTVEGGAGIGSPLGIQLQQISFRAYQGAE